MRPERIRPREEENAAPSQGKREKSQPGGSGGDGVGAE